MKSVVFDRKKAMMKNRNGMEKNEVGRRAREI